MKQQKTTTKETINKELSKLNVSGQCNDISNITFSYVMLIFSVSKQSEKNSV